MIHTLPGLKPQWADFENYMFQHGYSAQTIRSYKYSLHTFFLSHAKAVKYNYREILSYFKTLQERDISAYSKDSHLMAIKKYFDYLIERGIRDTHPCKTFCFKKRTNKKFIPRDVFSSEELEQLLEREERFEHLRLKNKCLISLLIYQGLLSSEIGELKLRHIDLDNGTIFISPNRKLSGRRLEFHPKQHRLFDQYIKEGRKRQLIHGEKEHFLLGYSGGAVKTEDIQFLIAGFKSLFPGRVLSPQNIRNSVIYNLLNVKRLPLEQIQLFAGHKWISTTARFLHEPIAQERELINRFHPLGAGF